ncbi:MAG: GTP cyclohydrolase II [Rhodospirillales bacterium]|nr:GTP cyclohydrolase II [Rhodospirillales bacterium]
MADRQQPAKNPSMPASREPVSLLSVDRAISELRRGRIICVHGGGGDVLLMRASESVTDDALLEISRLAGSEVLLALTARRAAILGLKSPLGDIVTLNTTPPITAQTVQDLADPLAACDLTEIDIDLRPSRAHDCNSAAVKLTKLARLLPAAVTAILRDPKADDIAAWCLRHDLLRVDAGDIFQYDAVAARTLKPVSDARVPLADAEQTRIVAFRPWDGGLEHLAIIIGEPVAGEPILTRLHSECFTGDLLGSLRCDCGDQLRGAISEISKQGAGVLLYLAQEGRGIGLVNKLRAYALQDQGFDTLDANEQLGYDADERIYLPAARMLEHLGFNQVRLMTNNPDKVSGLAHCGVVVTERVAHRIPSNHHNESYLQTKKTKGGHLI